MIIRCHSSHKLDGWDDHSDIWKNNKDTWNYLPCTQPQKIYTIFISRLDTKVTMRVNTQTKRQRGRPDISYKSNKQMWRYLPCTRLHHSFSNFISRLGTKVTARVNIQLKRPRIRPVAINCILCTRALHFDPYGDCQVCAMDGKRRSLRERPTTSV